MTWFVFFLITWAASVFAARRIRLSWILSVGGSLIAALLVLIAVVSLFAKNSVEANDTVGLGQAREKVDQTLAAMWDSLAPPPASLQGMAVLEAERLYRRLCVLDWNGELYLGSRRWNGRYSELAEKWEMHVNVIAGAFDYVADERVGRLSMAVGKHFQADPHIRHATIASTAWCGTYTLHAELELEGSPKDPALVAESEKIARDLVSRLPLWVTGMKIERVRYRWSKTGTSGNLMPAFLWRRTPEEFRVMTIAEELNDRVDSVTEDRWIQPSWNERQRAEE